MIRRKKKKRPKRYRDLPGRSMVPPPSPILSAKKERKKKKKKKKKPPPLVTGSSTRLLEPGTLRIYEDEDSTFQIFEDHPRLPRPQFSPVSSPRRQTERPLPLFSPLSSPRRQTERIRPRPLFSEEKDDTLLFSPLSSPLIGGLDDRLDVTLTPPPLRLSPTQSPRRSSRSPTPRGPIRRLNF